MLSGKQLTRLAEKIVNKSLRIGQKENPVYEKIRKKYAWLSGSFSLKTAVKKSGLEKKEVEKILEKYSDVEYGPIVLKKGKKYEVKEKIGQSVLILYNPATKTLAGEVEKACWKKGAHVLAVEKEAGRAIDSYLLRPEKSLYELPGITKAVYENIDFLINLECIEKNIWAKDIPVQRLLASAPANQRMHEIMDRKLTRWCIVGWPHPETAKELKIPLKKYRKIMFNSIFCSYKKKTKQIIEKYHAVFKDSKKIRIVANDGTDLSFSVSGRRFLKDDGMIDETDVKNKDVGLNIPCGEVFTAPVENTANGMIFFPKTMIRGEGIIKGFKLYFKNGRIVRYSAEKGRKCFKRFLKQNTGEKDRIAEFGIGCNRKAEYTGGDILIDEKIFKTIHIAIGWNTGFGGKNKASSHLDFIKFLEPCNGKVYADGKLVIDKGRLC